MKKQGRRTESKAQRSAIMARVKSKNTAPEMIVRRLVFRLGHRYRLHRADLAGKPDLVFPSQKKIIFVHGCFWHSHKASKCSGARLPKSNVGYWLSKLERNKARDAKHIAVLRAQGWRVLVIWECQLKKLDAVEKKIRLFLDEGKIGK